jgi:hypothetical protein
MLNRDDAPRSVTTIKRAARAAGSIESVLAKAARPLSTKGFPYRKPNVPLGVTVPRKKSKLGADYETSWARKYPARFGRVLFVEGPMKFELNDTGAWAFFDAGVAHTLRNLGDAPLELLEIELRYPR